MCGYQIKRGDKFEHKMARCRTIREPEAVSPSNRESIIEACMLEGGKRSTRRRLEEGLDSPLTIPSSKNIRNTHPGGERTVPLDSQFR